MYFDALQKSFKNGKVSHSFPIFFIIYYFLFFICYLYILTRFSKYKSQSSALFSICSLGIFLKNKGFLFHNHSILIKIRKCNIDSILFNPKFISDITTYLNDVLSLIPNSGPITTLHAASISVSFHSSVWNSFLHPCFVIFVCSSIFVLTWRSGRHFVECPPV
jgi:hypothetical protein